MDVDPDLEALLGWPLWAVVDAQGDAVELLEGSWDEACAYVSRSYGECVVDLMGLREQPLDEIEEAAAQLVANPPGGFYEYVRDEVPVAERPRIAYEALRLHWDRPNGITVGELYEAYPRGLRGAEEAFEELRYYFSELPRAEKRSAGGTWSSVEGFFDNIFGRTRKMAKELLDPEGKLEPRYSFGLALAPAHQAYPGAGTRGTACAGSTPACRALCLVRQGKWAADAYNLALKEAKTKALIERPVAFLRLLHQAIRAYSANWYERGFGVHPRLNEFSDVPWELVVTDLFPDLSHIEFYDYTKVPGRMQLPNYDLTFSYDVENHPESWLEVKERQRKLAVVFLFERNLGYGRTKVTERIGRAQAAGDFPKQMPLYSPDGSEQIMLPVVDGDLHDFRVVDPSPSIVALHYKPPTLFAGPKAMERATRGREVFVVPVSRFSDGRLVCPLGNRFTHRKLPIGAPKLLV